MHRTQVIGGRVFFCRQHATAYNRVVFLETLPNALQMRKVGFGGAYDAALIGFLGSVDLGYLEALHVRPQVREHIAAGPYGIDYFWIGFLPEDVLDNGNAEATHAVVQPVQHILWRGVAGRGIKWVGTPHGLINQGRVLHRTHQGANRIQRPAQGKDAVPTDLANRRLEPHRAAQRRRNAYGTAGVRAEGGRHQASTHGDTRSAAGAAWHVVLGVPGVVRGTVVVVDTRGAKGKLHRVGLAQHHHPGLIQAPHHGGVSAGSGVFQQVRPGRCRKPLHVDDVFGSVWDAVQGSGIASGP